MKTTCTAPPAFPSFVKAPTEYAALCALYLPRPVRTKAEAQAAARVVESLVGHDLSSDQEDYLEVVGHFLDEFDRAKRPQLQRADGLSVLHGLLADRDLTGADLSRLLGGSRNLGAMILRGERRLTTDHIRTLADYFGISPSVLI